jgi:hypothetical protein
MMLLVRPLLLLLLSLRFLSPLLLLVSLLLLLFCVWVGHPLHRLCGESIFFYKMSPQIHSKTKFPLMASLLLLTPCCC